LQELNARATHLLFRDKKRQLHLFNIAKQERTTLLPYCSYVQWVPGSDVVVAQSRSNLCVWYSINAPDQQTVVAIKGDVGNIERSRVSALVSLLRHVVCVELANWFDRPHSLPLWPAKFNFLYHTTFFEELQPVES